MCAAQNPPHFIELRVNKLNKTLIDNKRMRLIINRKLID